MSPLNNDQIILKQILEENCLDSELTISEYF